MYRLTSLALVTALAACSTPLEIGQACTDSADCREGLSCFFDDGTMTTSVCMEDCDEDTVRICEGGEVCIPATFMGAVRERGVCFLGGSSPVGEACVDTFDCVVGALCVGIDGVNSCERACRTDDDTSCSAGESCRPLMGSGAATDGYCASDS